MAKRPHLAVLRTLSKAHGLAGRALRHAASRTPSHCAAAQDDRALCRSAADVEAVLTLLEAPHCALGRSASARCAPSGSGCESALAELCRGHGGVCPARPIFFWRALRIRRRPSRAPRAAGLLVRDARGYPGLADALAHHHRDA